MFYHVLLVLVRARLKLWCSSLFRLSITLQCTNSRKEFRRNCSPIGHNNTKHFLCPIRSRHPLEFLEIARSDWVPRGSFASTWKLSSRLFSRPDWLLFGLRGCLSCCSKIYARVRYVSMWKQYVARAPVRTKKEAALVSYSISEARNSGNGKFGLAGLLSDDMHLLSTVDQYHLETRSNVWVAVRVERIMQIFDIQRFP